MAELRTQERVLGKLVGKGLLAKVIDESYRDFYDSYTNEDRVGIISASKWVNASGVEFEVAIHDDTVTVVIYKQNVLGEPVEELLEYDVTINGNRSLDAVYEELVKEDTKEIPTFGLVLVNTDTEQIRKTIKGIENNGVISGKFHDERKERFSQYDKNIEII